MNKKIFFVKAFLFVLLTAAASYANNFADTYGFSANGMCMGNAMTAHVNDWSSVYYNIAGLGKTADVDQSDYENDTAHLNQFATEVLFTLPQFDIDIVRYDDGDYGDGAYQSTPGDEDLDTTIIIVGMTVDINSRVYEMPEFISTARFGLGMGLPSDLNVAKVNDLDPRSHNYLRYGREADRLLLISGIGLGFMDDTFGIGLGINGSFSGDGKVLLKDVALDSSAPQTARSQSKMDLSIDPAYVFGLYLDMEKIFPEAAGLDFGLTYRMESQMEIDPFDTTAVTGVGAITLQLLVAIFDFYNPDSITAGFSYTIGDKILLALDFEYQKWSDYKVSSTKGINFGSDLPDLDDIWVPKIGMQYKKSDRMDILCGYYFQPSFVPDSAGKGEINFLDNEKHVASIGIRYKVPQKAGLKGPVALTAGYQFQYHAERDVTKTSPTGLNPNYSYGGHCHSFTFGFTY